MKKDASRPTSLTWLKSKTKRKQQISQKLQAWQQSEATANEKLRDKAWVALALNFLQNDPNTNFKPFNLEGGNSTKSNYLRKAGKKIALRSQRARSETE